MAKLIGVPPSRPWPLAIVATLAASPLPAQRLAQPGAEPTARAEVVAALRRELASAAAAQRSGYARSGEFGRDIWSFVSDSLVRVWPVQTDSAGWSAIALHRIDRGLRCAVAIGTAAPLLNGASTSAGPVCIADDGEPLAADPVGADAAWLYWSTDLGLDIGPRPIDCPPLSIPELPLTNDSIYAEFIVGVDGRVESSPVGIESTGGLDASVGMLMRLSRCRFEPALRNGAPVRAILRQTIGLAPDRPLLPASAAESPFAAWPVAQAVKASSAMRAALLRVAAAQGRYHSTTGGYTPRVPAAATVLGSDPAIRVTMLSWSATGWSAMASHDSTPVRCFASKGDGVPAPAAGPAGGEPFCVGPGGRRLAETAQGQPSGEEETAGLVGEPPRRQRCNTRFQFRDDPLRRVRVVLEFVVGTDGRPDPRTLQVVASSGLLDAAGAVQVLASCRYAPGRNKGRRVPVVVRQPVYFN